MTDVRPGMTGFDEARNVRLMKHWNNRKKKYPRDPILLCRTHLSGIEQKKNVNTNVRNTGDNCKSSGSDGRSEPSAKRAPAQGERTYNYRTRRSDNKPVISVQITEFLGCQDIPGLCHHRKRPKCHYIAGAY
jgi:hypothetical protein